MQKKATKIFSFFLCAVLLFQQSGFAQVAAELNLSSHFLALQNSFLQPDIFRPLHLRFLGYDTENNNFNLLLDKGDLLKGQLPNDIAAEKKLKDETSELMRYFLIGITLPNESFWVNLRPDAEDNIIDLELARTDIGKVFLEADLQLKKDTASFTSPQTPEGKEYWDRLYKKAEQLYGHENITIPTLTRPWIVPDEIIIREAKDNAYIYKATLKVMLEQDYLKSAVSSQLSATSVDYTFKDERSKALNEYSTQLIRELIIPNLTREVNTSKRYAPLRQVYYSLILAQWFKATHPSASSNKMAKLINSKDLTNFTSKSPWSKATYFNAYKQSFAQGEYNIKEPVYTPTGQVIRSYFSGGIMTRDLAPTFRNSADSSILNKDYLVSMRADSFGNVMALSVSSSPVAGDHAQPQVTFDKSASPLVLLGSSTDNSEEKNPFFDFKSYSFFDNNFSYSGSKTDYFNLTLKNNPLGMGRLKDNIISQIDAANAKDKKLIYYINAGQDADIGYLLETIAGYIKEKGYSGFELNIMVSTILSKSVEKAKEVLENCASGYGGLFDLNYAVIRMNNLDKGSVNKFVVLVKSAFGNFDGIMCNIGGSSDALEIVPAFTEMLKQGAWLQIDEDLEYLERKGWQPPVEHFGDKICGNEFTLLLGYYSPLSPEERVRVLLEENEGLNNIFRSNFFKKKGKVEIEHYKEMISNFLQIPFDKKDEIQSKIDSEDESEKIKNARLMWAKSKWGPSSYWGLTLEQAVCLHELPPLPEGQAYDFAFHMLLTYIWQFAGTKEQVEDLLETLGGDGGGVGLWLEPWEMTYRYLWAAKIIYQNNTSTFSPVALEPAQPQETSRNLTESQGTSNNAASPLAQSELIESSNVLTDRLLKDFSITDALNYSFLRENIYYLFYELQKTLGAVINRRDYSFILDMLVWEDELAIAGKSLPDGYLSQERELYINLNSEIARQVRRWIAERRFEIHSDKTTLETFLQFNYDGLIANYIHRLYYHITHQYTDTFHLENMALAIDQFYKNLERVGVEHADRFINRPLKKNLYLYGSIRHTLGIGDIDVGIYNPEWNKEKGILRLSDSDSVDLWLWKGEPNESAVKLPEVLTDAKQAKNLARFIYGIRLVQREFMRRGLAVPIVAVGQLAAIRWADERKVNEADVSAIIKADLVTVRQVAEFINGASVERMLNDPGLGIFDKAAGRLNEINAQRKHFRENINIDAKAADAVRLRKLATFDAFMQSPFFEVNEKGYFAERKKLIEDLLSTKSVVASIPSSSEISASSLKGKVKAFDGSPAELEPEKSIEELKAELNDLIDKYPDPQWKRFAITIFEDLIDRKRNEREYLKLLIIVTKLPLGDPSRDCQVLYSLLNTYADGVNRLKLLQDIVYAVKPMSEKRNLENSLKFISQLFASGLYEPSELNDIRQLIDKIDAISEESYEYELRKSKEMNRRFGDDAADILIQYHDLYSILDLLTVLVQTGLIFDRGILLTYTEQIIKIVQKALRIEKEPYYEAFTFPDEVLGIFDNLLIYRPITSEELADIASLPNSKFLAQVDELRKEFFRGWEDGRGGWRSLGLRKSGRAYSWKDSQWYQYYRERKGGAQISIGVPSDEIRSNYDKLVKLGRQDEAATTLIRLVRMVLEGRGDLQQDMIFDTLKEFFGVKVFEKKEILKNIVRVHPEHKEIFSQGLQGSAKQVAPILFSVYDCVDRLDNNASSLDVYNSVKNDLVEALNRAIEIMNEWVRDAPFPADSKNALQSASVGKELKLTGSSPLEQGIRKVLKQIEATVFSPSDITTFRQCRVYRNSGLKVIVKELIDNVIPDGPRAGYYFKKKALKGYQLAQQRLGGLVVPFTIVDLQLNVENADAISQTSINSAVILKKVKDHDLTDKIKYLARQRRIEEIKELVRIVFKMDHEMMKRGCYLPDPILENFGILENGTIVLIDPGFLVSDDTIDNQVIASDWFLRGKSHHLNNIFLNSLKEESGLSDEEIKEIKMAYGEASGVYPDEFDDKYFDFFETFIKHERYYARGEQEFKEFYHSCKPGDEIPVVFLTSSPVAEDLEPVVITDDRESRTDNQKSNKGASPVLISDIEPIRRAYRPFENKADIREFVEGPLIEACTIFYEAGIETIFTSANKEDLKRINRRGDGGRYAYLEIKYDGNKYKYMDTAGSRWAYGGIKIDIENVPFSDHMKSAKIYIPISGQTTAEELSRKAVEIAKSFYKNDVKDVSASSIGGIDMRDLVKHTLIKKQGQGSFGSIGDFSNNRELEEIQRMIQAGIIPSTNRLEECQKSCQAEALISCIADILRMEEERVTATEAGIKQLLVNLESG